MNDLITTIGIMRGNCDENCEGYHCYYHHEDIEVKQ